MPVDASLLEPFERLIAVTIEGRDFAVPENNSVLRLLQWLDFDLDPCRLCWNSDCDNCHVLYTDPASAREIEVRGCEMTAFEGMRISRVPPHAVWPSGG